MSPRGTRPGADPFLRVILLGLGGLLVAGGIAVVLARQPVPALPADSPGGTTQQFYQALGRQDYDRAYGLLSRSLQDTTTHAEFIRYNLSRDGNQNADRAARVRLAGEKTHDDDAVVTVAITHYSANPGPFGSSSEWTESQAFTLHRETGTWRITAVPDGYLPYTRP